jgi:type I restriction enzyme S subunit
MSRWPSVPLASLVRSGRGISYGIVQPGVPRPDGVPVLRVTDIRNGRVDTRSPLRVAPQVEAAHARTRLAGGELLMTLVGTVGETALVPDNLKNWNVARAIAVIPVDEGVGARWVKLALEAPAARDLIKARLNTTVQATLNLRDVAELPVLMPPECERLAIMAAICALDDKIELNRRTGQTLEAIVQAIFKSWFVDSTPDTGRPSTLKDLTSKIGSGATPRGGRDVYVDEGVALIRSQNVYDSQFVWDGLARITDEAATQLANVQVQPGDVLLNITGASILRTCVVPPDVLPARVNQHVAIIRAKPGVSPHYLHLHLLQPETKAYLLGLNAGGSREAVTKAHIESAPIINPGEDVLGQFHGAVAPLFAQAQACATEARWLASLRDALLPKLLSGELTPTAA